MKKSLAAGLFAVGLIAAGSTGFYVAHANEKAQDPVYYMQQGMGNSQMTQMMNNTGTTAAKQQTPDQGSSFEQMLPYMRKMHPGLSDAQLKSLYESMHGPNGACGNLHGGTETNTQSTSNNL